jgi:hypothetical protein
MQTQQGVRRPMLNADEALQFFGGQDHGRHCGPVLLKQQEKGRIGEYTYSMPHDADMGLQLSRSGERCLRIFPSASVPLMFLRDKSRAPERGLQSAGGGARRSGVGNLHCHLCGAHVPAG